MSRNRLTILLIVAFAIPAILIVAALSVSRTRGVWTDGMALRVPLADAHARDVIWRPAESVPGSINSEIDEYEPRASPDGTTLVFVRRRPGVNSDLMMSRWTPQGWTAPEAMASINTDSDELQPEFSADGRSLWFASNREGGLGGFDLWYATAEVDGAAWNHAVNAGDLINSRFDEYGPALTPDGGRVYFASDRPRADEALPPTDDVAWSATMRERKHRHDHDLYVASLDPSAPARPQRLTQLCTPFDEGAPAVTAAGDFLYFASDRPNGVGGFDLYRSRIIDTIPQPPELLDATVNSLANDLDPAVASDGFRLYFSSDRVQHEALPTSAAVAEPADYSIWWTTSREVFRAEPSFGSSLAAVWSTLWPWLLLVLALLAAALLLAWLIHALIRSVDWRGRFARLNLLAKCLVLSLLLHLLIASLLTVWTVGLKVGEMMSPGGTRVILASAATDEDASEQAALILAAPIGADDLALLTTPMAMSIVSPEAPAIEAQPTPEPPLLARATDAVPHIPSVALPTTLPAPMPRANAALELTTPRAPAPSASVESEPAATTPVVAMTATPITAPAADARAAVQAEEVDVPIRTSAPSQPTSTDLRASSPLPTVASSQAPSRVSVAFPVAPKTESTTVVQEDAVPKPIVSATDALLPSIAQPLARVDAPIDVPLPRATVARPAPTTTPPTPTAAQLPMARVPATAATYAPRLPLPPTEAPAPVETFAQRDPEARSALVDELGGSAETEKAVRRALEWLRRTQEPDGHWSSRAHESQVDADGAMTGLALLSFLGAGHTHLEDGPYRATVEKALGWLLARANTSGDLRGSGGGADSMFGQTIAAVSLCEAYAMTRDPALAVTARRATDFVIAASRTPRSGRDADTAVLGWLIMTVESARRAGFEPPADVFVSARSWLDTVSRPTARGRYAYRAGDAPSVGMTAEAMFVQQILGRSSTEPRMEQSAQFLLTSPPRWNGEAPTHSWYYATLALFQQQGDAWKSWNESLAPLLIEHQRTDGAFDGSWDPQDKWSRMCGRVYQTAICTLSLEVYYRYRLKERGE